MNEFEQEIFDPTPFDSLEGKFLVSTQSLDGGLFEKAVIYMCAHDAHGAIGVIVNHLIGTFSLKDYISDEDLKRKIKGKRVSVMYGGPVSQDRIVILTVTKDQKKNFDKLKSVTVYTDSEKFLKDFALGNVTDKFIAIKGVSAWDAIQLEQEIAENSWLIAPANLEIIFSQRIKNKWQKVINQIGVKDFSNLVNYTGNA